MDKQISEKAVLDVLRDYYRAWFLNDERFMDAVNAIKAIPSAEPCEDAISREAVIDKVIDAVDEWDGGCNKSRATLIEEAIRELPPVKPQEPKTGHWKRISMDKYSEHAKYWYRCDRCGERNLGNTDFCPHCGARMIEPQERSEE